MSDPTPAQVLQSTLSSAPLHIVQSKHTFSSAVPSDELPNFNHKDPLLLASDVSEHLSYLRKQKFQYLELNAKDKYIKTIVSDHDDAPLITLSTNEALRLSNETKKEKLKEAKSKLAQKQADIRRLAPLAEQDYNKAVKATTESATLASQILDARLSLTRLRQSHASPQHRLTIPSALQLLDTQSQQLQDLDTELQTLQKKVGGVKDKVKSGSREVERLRVERADMEALVRSKKGQEGDDEDRRLAPLYDWYTASLELQHSLHYLVSSVYPTESSLELTYVIRPPSSQSPKKTPRITIAITFHDNTHLLSSASISSTGDVLRNEDAAEFIEQRVGDGDVGALVAGILAMARARVRVGDESG